MNEYLKQYIELQKQFRETEGDPDSVRALYTFKEKLELSEDKQAKEVLVDVYDLLDFKKDAYELLCQIGNRSDKKTLKRLGILKDYAENWGNHYALPKPKTPEEKQKEKERHARHRVRSYDGNGVGSHCGEEEGYYGNEQYAHNGEEQVALHYAGPEEYEGDYYRGYRAYGDNLEGDVALCAGQLLGSSLVALHLLCGKTYGLLDDAPRLDDAYDAGHGYAADADILAVSVEDVFRRHCSYGCAY